MGLFDALSDLASATVKTALTPVAVVKDVFNVATGQEANDTKDLLKSAASDVEEAGHDLTKDL